MLSFSLGCFSTVPVCTRRYRYGTVLVGMQQIYRYQPCLFIFPELMVLRRPSVGTYPFLLRVEPITQPRINPPPLLFKLRFFEVTQRIQHWGLSSVAGRGRQREQD